MKDIIWISARLAVGLSVGLWLIGGQAAEAQVQQRRFNIGDVVDTDGQLIKIHECSIRPDGGEQCLVQGWEGGGPSSQKVWMYVANIIAGMERMAARTGRSAVISQAAPPVPAVATPDRPPALSKGAQAGRRFNIGDVVDT
ncbi:MAG: hypothetical protein Q8M69_02565, partial [Reyranella sp.]|nr:hypothetical protein [Reyranella sp.]